MVDFKPFVDKICERAHAASGATSALEGVMSELSCWESYLFNKHPHMLSYEQMTAAVEREFIYLGSIGLFRPALASLRSFFELNMAWIYYSSHPMEWRSCQVNGTYFLTPGAVIKEVQEYLPFIRMTFPLLFGVNKIYKIRSPYNELSKHVHTADPILAPKIAVPTDLIGESAEFDRLLQVSRQVRDYILNWFAATLTPEKWTDFPREIREQLAKRVPADDLPVLRRGER